MKLFYFLIISLFISNVLQSQSFQTDERVWNSATQRAFSDLGRTKLTKPVLGNIVGSEYYETEFKEGRIVHLDKSLEIKTSLRYNAYNDEIELIDMSSGTKSVKAAIKNSRIISFFDNNEYNYLKYLDSKNIAYEGYLIPVFKGLKIDIYERKRKKFIKGKDSVNSLDNVYISLLFFFFKQKTAYEISECDWSSDVCSSDLSGTRVPPTPDGAGLRRGCEP